jgi:ATP-dependent helicase/nuclease subunit A
MAIDQAAISPEKGSRDLDPNVAQRRASDPAASSWVAASAGTGKTKVLSDRVLRLLLTKTGDNRYTAPHKILCLTFTKTAASEMAMRVNERLSRWAVMKDEELQKDLKENLLGREPDQGEVHEARRLFAKVLDSPGGLNVMNVHSFCQSVLKRFPLEAGVSPQFEVADENRADELLSAAIKKVVTKARSEPGSGANNSLNRLAATVNEDQLRKLLESFCRERRQMEKIISRFWSPEGVHSAVCNYFGISPSDSEEAVIHEACRDGSFDYGGLQEICAALPDSSKKRSADILPVLHEWLAGTEEQRSSIFGKYCNVFFTEGVIRARLLTKDIVDSVPGSDKIMTAEALRLQELVDRRKAVQCAGSTLDLLVLNSEISKEYERLKESHAVLDYDDLILRTLHLLEKETPEGEAPSPRWVMYKLDQGLDHILVDEAQDTNPEQWQVIEALSSEFFAGLGARGELNRTVFAVGDIKQSIYGFLRAAPDEFLNMRGNLGKRAGEIDHEFRNVALNISFRSTETVLRLVDEVFADEEARKALGPDYEPHKSFRRGQAGVVEIWPFFEDEKKDKPDLWDPPVTAEESSNAKARLAKHIAETIRKWLDEGEELPSHDRSIEAGDILILVRTRNALVNQIIRELKLKQIPVGGLDKMVLGEQLVVQDMLGFLQFALLPEDDLNLAAILKSPLIGFGEEEIFELASKRKGSLWQSLKNSKFNEIYQYMDEVIRVRSKERPYEFLGTLLHRPCPADPGGSGLRAIRARLGEEALDPLEELLSDALNYEKNNIPSLQGFLQTQTGSEREIKREQEEKGGGQVRVMTVHGAKGLQAPVVILPDTIREKGSNKIQRLLWPDKTGLEFPVWSVRKDEDPRLYRERFEEVRSRMDEEAMRLLYVAMTRAEDRLYVAGAKGQKTPDENSWYFHVKRAFENLGAEQCEENGTLRITGKQTKPADKARKEESEEEQITQLPRWLYESAPEEPDPPKPLMPSRPSESEPAASSPLTADESNYRYRRGNLTHKLLQYLPELPPEKREQAAASFLEKQGRDLPEEVLKGIAGETLAVLENPEFAPLFAPGSFAEVPVTGLLPPGKIVSGQIDRLAVTEDEVLIVDYKTNRPPPALEKDIPQIYRRQMQSYREVISQVYPSRKIRCFLLWTDGAVLMEL